MAGLNIDNLIYVLDNAEMARSLKRIADALEVLAGERMGILLLKHREYRQRVAWYRDHLTTAPSGSEREFAKSRLAFAEAELADLEAAHPLLKSKAS